MAIFGAITTINKLNHRVFMIIVKKIGKKHIKLQVEDNNLCFNSQNYP